MKPALVLLLVVALILRAAPPAEAKPSRSRAPGQVNGYPCGGDLPPCWVLYRESRGNPVAQNRHSSASGLWQFIDGTWGRYGGFRHARQAPVDVQNEKARLTWNHGRGCRHWSAC